MAVDPTWIGLGILSVTSLAGCVTAAVAIRRNGTASKDKIEADSKAFGALLQEVTNLKEAVSDPEHGLHAIKEEVSKMRTHCASITGGFGEKLEAHEKRLDTLSKRRK